MRRWINDIVKNRSSSWSGWIHYPSSPPPPSSPYQSVRAQRKRFTGGEVRTGDVLKERNDFGVSRCFIPAGHTVLLSHHKPVAVMRQTGICRFMHLTPSSLVSHGQRGGDSGLMWLVACQKMHTDP